MPKSKPEWQGENDPLAGDVISDLTPDRTKTVGIEHALNPANGASITPGGRKG